MQPLTDLRSWWDSVHPTGVPVFIAVIITLGLGVAFSRFAGRATQRILSRTGLSHALVQSLSGVARWLVLAFALVSVLETLGVETSSGVAVLASAGLALGLSLQGSLGHFANGVLLLIFRPFDLGDFVQAGGEQGTVLEMGVFGVTLVTVDNRRVTVPNTVASSNTMINLSVLGARRLELTVGVAYGTDIDRAEAIIVQALRGQPFLSVDRPIEVQLDQFAPSSLELLIWIWSTPEEVAYAQSKARRLIYSALQGAAIELPLPQLVVRQQPGPTTAP